MSRSIPWVEQWAKGNPVAAGLIAFGAGALAGSVAVEGVRCVRAADSRADQRFRDRGGVRWTCGRPRTRRKAVEVTVVDPRNYHLFQPLLSQVATASLSAQDVAHAVRGLFQSPGNVKFRMAKATGVDFDARKVRVEAGQPLPL